MAELFAPLPPGPFQILAADPPWTFQTYSEKGKGRSPERHYPCLTAAQIAELGIELQRVADPDSVLLLWATSPHLATALDVMRAWGYTYKTVAFVWVKVLERVTLHGGLVPAMGTGYYTRANAEYVLLGRRGHGVRRYAADVSQIILAPRGRHSEKPRDVFYRVERLFGVPERGLRALELFSRSAPYGPHWSVWGNEAQPAENQPQSPTPRQGYTHD